MNFNYLPKEARISGDNVFLNENFIGYIEKINNWGTDFLARNENNSSKNKFFTTKKEAVLYLIEINKEE